MRQHRQGALHPAASQARSRALWEEKHFKNPPSAPKDQNTHLFTLIIQTDNTFEIQIDGERKASGSLNEDMDPPVNAPKEIDDPDDLVKPSDWVDDKKIDDPASSKAEDWDETQPRMIPDESARKPDAWDEDAPKRIPDPQAKRPEDWDEDEDGEWEAPTVDNPACQVGCGKWETPKISNPQYKGKWHAPKIDNPDYVGEWKPRRIDNPDFFEDPHPHLLPVINAVGIDIWTVAGWHPVRQHRSSERIPPLRVRLQR